MAYFQLLRLPVGGESRVTQRNPEPSPGRLVCGLKDNRRNPLVGMGRVKLPLLVPDHGHRRRSKEFLVVSNLNLHAWYRVASLLKTGQQVRLGDAVAVGGCHFESRAKGVAEALPPSSVDVGTRHPRLDKSMLSLDFMNR